MNDLERTRCDEIAGQLALLELVRFAVGEICFHTDQAVFAQRMQAVEEGIINDLNSRTIFDRAPAETESYIKEAIAAQVTKILTSIRHPEEQAP
ncbi:hypothetical protein [Sinorhizobium meliloti]|uniref:hypothetical protein n=1 Tax=Rhizobium meliloti TaxID=382 RepID=UPI000C9CBCDC|nr:hypothetical protein CN934_03360 [Ensifer sp. MMN_5]